MSFILDLFDSSDNPKSLGAKFRGGRQKMFETLFFQNFNSEQSIKILDVGGYSNFWKNSALLQIPGLEITLLNLQAEKTSNPIFNSLKGDATHMPEFESQSFDLVFSNSVIEHLYTFENQQKMAKEILRVGKKHFIQTPNKFFPIEAHYALPFAQFMPKSWVFYLLTKTKLSRLHAWEPEAAQQYLDEIRLLDEGEVKALFPQSSIYREKVMGLCKSIVAHNL
ncbi:methyltransferase domain-containing protein [Algoriphagus sp. CAU 1675]|uniref:methyltransferase domain-containing protein n=1 Tax=Algoriphagus sp. CAU 1675 TaxID=3032597 RepID=UPI0023DBE57C|nr:methyltransferase domain-containing protein [Algoriphagus sp. CAU 1675]MDF2156267.1 methyltransferase domain-containing protein [Algoriphagus sp. CAU 1675]